MIRLALFDGRGSGSGDLPDQDGVVRSRCVGISGPSPGSGKSLHGLELGLKQAFDFLPGVLRNTGVDANCTSSPSNVGVDVASNYRSKRAVSEDYGGITGFQEYQAPTTYIDASASYSFASHFRVFLEGSNLTHDKERHYLVWPGMKLNTSQFEAHYALGVRAKF